MKHDARRNPTYTRRVPLLLASVGLGVLLAVAGQAANWNPYMVAHRPSDAFPLSYTTAPASADPETFAPLDCAFFPASIEPGRPRFDGVGQRIRYTQDLGEGPGMAYESYLKNNAGIADHVHDPWTGLVATPNRYRVIGPLTKDEAPCMPAPPLWRTGQ